MPDESHLVLDARALVARAVQVIDDSKKRRLHSLASLTHTIEHVTWSDQLIGESRLVVDRLREAIATFVAYERDNGAPPERVVRLVKGIVVDAKTDKLDPNDARSFLDDVVRWAIEGYYDDAVPRSVDAAALRPARLVGSPPPEALTSDSPTRHSGSPLRGAST